MPAATHDPRLQPDTTAAQSDAAPTDAPTRPDNGRWADRGVEPREGGGTTWVLVADEAIARILTTTEVAGALDPVEALTDPAAHAKEGELHVNDAGRRGGRVSHDGGRSGTGAGGASMTSSAGEASQHLEARSFAKRVAERLASGLRQKRYDALRIVAAPRFLGLLRPELDAAVRAVVVEEIAKDLIHEQDDDIARRLLAGASTQTA